MSAMPQIIGGEEYLNARETAGALGMSYVTFQGARDRDDVKEILHPHKLLGKGNSIFYKRSEIEEVKKKLGVQPAE